MMSVTPPACVGFCCVCASVNLTWAGKLTLQVGQETVVRHCSPNTSSSSSWKPEKFASLHFTKHSCLSFQINLCISGSPRYSWHPDTQPKYWICLHSIRWAKHDMFIFSFPFPDNSIFIFRWTCPKTILSTAHKGFYLFVDKNPLL